MRSDDEVLVTRCLEGDQPAFAFLVNKYKEVVHAYAYRKVADYQQAEDITQEVFIKAYKKLAQLKWPHRFQSWLYAITSNECKLWLRRNSKGQEQELSWEDVPSENLDELAVRNHSDEDIDLTVESAMETLPDDRQLVLSLFYMSSMSIKEIAYFMGVSPNSIGIKLHRARKQLGERLEKMIGKQLGKEKLRSGFVFKIVDSIKDMPIPSLPKPRSTKWMPIPISIGMALLIGIIGFGMSSGKDVSSDMPILKPETFAVSLLIDSDGQTISDAESESINNLVSADVESSDQTQPTAGKKSSGMVVRQLWETTLDTYSVSPNGRYVSYINWKNGNVAIHDFETGESRDITDEGNWDEDSQYADMGCMSTWSPDSKQIAYVWYKGEEASIRIVGIDGAKPRVLLNKPSVSELPWPWFWSPDGNHILISGEEKIMLLSVANGSIRVLKPIGHYVHGMRLSPDGRYIVSDSAHDKDLSKGSDIFLISIDGSYETTLVEHPADDYFPIWTPDGNQIVFISDRSGSTGIWSLEVVDGKQKGSPQLISDGLNGMRPLGLTQDGSYCYRLPGRQNDLYFAEIDPETGKVVKPPYKAVQTFEGLNGWPAFSADGKRLAYMSRRPDKWPFVIRSLETGEEHEMVLSELQPNPLLESFAASAPRWLPDGSSILVIAKTTDSNREKRVGIHQIHIETGEVTPIVWSDEQQGGLYKPTLPVCSPDGSKMFFMRQGGGFRIYDLDAEQEQRLHFQGLAGARGSAPGLALSPDGRQLAFITVFDDGFSIRIAPAAGGETREVFRLPKAEKPQFPDGAWLLWTPDGRYLLFARRKDEATELCRIPVEGGEPQSLGLTMDKMENLSIHPDGRRIAFTGPGLNSGARICVMEDVVPISTASR